MLNIDQTHPTVGAGGIVEPGERNFQFIEVCPLDGVFRFDAGTEISTVEGTDLTDNIGIVKSDYRGHFILLSI
jgi:hypothetical protein